MKTERETLRIIEALPHPRHLFIIPDWADPVVLDRLIDQGYLTCAHHQRDDSGVILVAMGLQLTEKGNRLIHPEKRWKEIVWKGSLAGASFALISVLILYLG